MTASPHALFGTPGCGPVHWLTATTRGVSTVDFGNPAQVTTANCPSSTPDPGVTVTDGPVVPAASACTTPAATVVTAATTTVSAAVPRRRRSRRAMGCSLQLCNVAGTATEHEQRREHEQRHVQRGEHERCGGLRLHMGDRSECGQPAGAELAHG